MVNESGLPLTAIEDNTVLAFGAGGANLFFIVIIYSMVYIILRITDLQINSKHKKENS